MKNIVANVPLNYQPINVNETEQPLHVGPAGVGTGQEGHAALQFRVEKTNEIFSGVLHTGTSEKQTKNMKL